MFRSIGKFIAVTLAFWLPLFSGNALAVSIGMQSLAGNCPSVVAQQSEHQAHCASTTQQHLAQHDAKMQHSTVQQDQRDAADENCGTCRLACCGFMATALSKIIEAPPSAQLFASFSSQFQSVTSTPLDPPPLARV